MTIDADVMSVIVTIQGDDEMTQTYVEDAGLWEYYQWCKRKRRTHKCMNGEIYRIEETHV